LQRVMQLNLVQRRKRWRGWLRFQTADGDDP
jgi:hypothetical protein